jgi:hypothetical protein
MPYAYRTWNAIINAKKRGLVMKAGKGRRYVIRRRRKKKWKFSDDCGFRRE